MTFDHKNIPSIHLKFKKIKKNVLVVGGGRWANIILNELISNFRNIKKISVITKNKNIIKKLPSEIVKKISLNSNLNNINLKQITHAIIVNKNSDHFLTAKKIIKHKINILVEKPLVYKIKEYEILKKLSYKKRKLIHVSTPFFFAYYFFYIKKLITTNNAELTFEWHDPKNDKRHGILKKYDKSVNYLEDTVYHIYGILNCLFGKKKITYVSSKNFKDHGNLIFRYGEVNINLNCSRNQNKKRIRKIRINSINKIIRVNYSDDEKVILTLNGKKKNINYNFCQKTLKYQLFNFLNTKKYSKNYCLNDIRNFDNLFYLIKNIR